MLVLWLFFWGIVILLGFSISRGKLYSLANKGRRDSIPDNGLNRIFRWIGLYCYSIAAAGALREIVPLVINLNRYIHMLNIMLVSYVFTATLIMLMKLRQVKVES
ncbi:hypothetical protein EJP77_20355 [Paenibacillus zeisoli]|uniref:DUF3784 domain-containing protein n=1 Tax=Paenibacillus zeisoli TaxID=2496267 RepID=A0A3S1B2W1_9BACL|nr:hypothetical protein [Paenibacillus zeisoli]RUT27670.1 hypothetical protein EJP77_20355 [Paenibacillus zeisoli]